MIRKYIKNKAVPFLFDISGRKVLSADDVSKIGIGVRVCAQETIVKVPRTIDFNSDPRRDMSDYEISFPKTHIYRIDSRTHGDCLRRYNAIVLNGRNIVASGIDENLGKLAAITPRFSHSKTRREDVIIAPWPHLWATYGDFIFFVLPKLARLWANMTNEERDRAVIALPFSLGDWSHQYVELLGIPRERHIDSMREQVGLSQSGVLITGDGPSHQQAIAHPDDHSRMKEFFTKHLCKQQSTYGKRIYVSRSGRRKLENEKKIFGKLEKLGFSFLPDQLRSASEQIAIFSDAEIVAGPHGAGLCNAVWGSSLVSILEAKSSAWDLRSFHNWCAMRGAPYRVLFDRGAGEPLRLNVDQSNNDLKISPDNFYKAAESIISL